MLDPTSGVSPTPKAANPLAPRPVRRRQDSASEGGRSPFEQTLHGQDPKGDDEAAPQGERSTAQPSGRTGPADRGEMGASVDFLV